MSDAPTLPSPASGGGETRAEADLLELAGVSKRFGRITVADRLSLFPRFSMRFLWNLPGNGGPSLDLITIRGFAPLLFTLVPHFYIGFGPEFSTDVSNSSVTTKETAFGLATEIGGYF